MRERESFLQCIATFLARALLQKMYFSKSFPWSTINFDRHLPVSCIDFANFHLYFRISLVPDLIFETLLILVRLGVLVFHLCLSDCHLCCLFGILSHPFVSPSNFSPDTFLPIALYPLHQFYLPVIASCCNFPTIFYLR